MPSSEVLSVYRQLIRAVSQKMKGDTPALTAAYSEIRSQFQLNANVADQEEVHQLCAEGRDAAHFLTNFVVQGKLNERGNFAVSELPSEEEHVHFKDPTTVIKGSHSS